MKHAVFPKQFPPEIRMATEEEIERSETLLGILKSYPPSVAVDMLVFTCTQLIMAMVADDPAKINRIEVWRRISDAVRATIQIIEARHPDESDQS